MTDRSQILFVCTEQFKDALGIYASQKRMAASEVIRIAVAQYIGYNLDGEQIQDKRRKYGSVQERKEAQQERQRTKRREAAKLLEAFGHEQHLFDVEVIEKSLAKSGRR